jgi:hypothetical protein
MKIINDTLKVKGKWAHKRVLSFVSFHVGVAYAFTPAIYPEFEVHEFVVLCFFGLSAGCLGIDLQQKIKVQEDDSYIGTQINNNNEIIG